MMRDLLEIHPRELKFIFELKKQSLCSIQLVNNSLHYVAFKVKTTSPKKYCVRPNVGIVKPKSTLEFTVTMQPPQLAPPDMECKDKFLIQSTIVSEWTNAEDITPSMFAKDDGKKIEENKLRVILISPPSSPVLSPISGPLKQDPADESSNVKDQLSSRLDVLSPHHIASKVVKESKFFDDEKLRPAKKVELKIIQDTEDLKRVKDMEEMKFKLDELELKLCEAEVTISKLTEERRLTMKEREVLQEEIAILKNKSGSRRDRVGFPFLFVCMVAVISVLLGYLVHY